ncbi:MAG: VanZ family protein [Candidatus Omnitrophica bacterium]|nr:VanZ family protein [Candidatus Omnitrophota bacterium]
MAARFIKYWLPVIIYAIFIFSVSSIPGTELPGLFKGQDIVFHILGYAVFAFLINRALREYFSWRSRLMRLSWVFVIAIIYALSDEFHQSFIPYRLASWKDIVSDGLGIFIASIFSR